MDKGLQRAITLTELAPSPYFSIINVHPVDIHVFAKFDEISSLPLQVIKERPKCRGVRLTKGNNLKKYTSSPFSIYEIPSLPFQDIEKTKRRGRTNGRTDGRTDGQRENSIPPQTQFAGGGGGGIQIFPVIHMV